MLNLHEIFEKYNITSVTDDTREVVEGCLYFAVKGKKFNGEDAAAEMLAKGAAAIVTENDLGLDGQLVVGNVRLEYARAVSHYYGNPTEKLTLVGITGTNGKTTTATLVRFILTMAGHKCGFIGTTGYDACRADGEVETATLTTPTQKDLYRLFSEMVKNGATHCVMEVSSQALAQYRLADEMFEVAVFTNLSQDHIDVHGSFECYYQAKKRLFTMCKAAIICVDDKHGKRLSEELKRELDIPVLEYCTDDYADFYALNIKTGNSSVSYLLSDYETGNSSAVKLGMPGLFNVANSIAAIAACKRIGVEAADSCAALSDFSGVRGRCEVIHSGEFTVICDYAHTEDALLKILTCVRSFAKRRVICLFGAAGERDADKRSAMGETVAKYSDYLVVTSDNPRFENPEDIINQVVSSLAEKAKSKKAKNLTPYKTFVDRREAIEFALSEADENDIVLLCGKGHEAYQVIGDEYQPFDEREIVKELLKD